MPSTRSGYRAFSIELVSLDQSRRPKRPPMEEEKRDDGVGDPIKSLLEESLERQRNEIMDSFSKILMRMSAMVNSPSTSMCFKDETPFKVQVNFDIPLFEGKINVDALYN